MNCESINTMALCSAIFGKAVQHKQERRMTVYTDNFIPSVMTAVILGSLTQRQQ